jgi:hypothetical protein
MSEVRLTNISWITFIPMIGGLVTLVGVWIQITVSGQRLREDRRRDDEKRAEDAKRTEVRRIEDARERDKLQAAVVARVNESTAAGLLGMARIVRSRLSIIYQTGGYPIEGYVPFDRLITAAYQGAVASLVADRYISVDFFRLLGEFEQTVGSARFSLEQIAKLAPPGAAQSTFLQLRVDEERRQALNAAYEAARVLDQIRALLGDTSPVPEPRFPDHELAAQLLQRRTTSPGHPAEPVD